MINENSYNKKNSNKIEADINKMNNITAQNSNLAKNAEIDLDIIKGKPDNSNKINNPNVRTIIVIKNKEKKILNFVNQ